ncbi:MAG: ABC transporter substrate-binding protein [Bacteroidales bacterium]|nr:ABC transporter substrate-binding protein [Bacteroidales bacterium]
MKKFASILLALATVVACSENRDQVLKVYNWSNYIDEDVIPEFEQWYRQQTGSDIKVIYQTFDINETMLAKIEKGHEDFDVVCPSDYIIERMLNSGLLIPLDFASLPDSINYIKNNRSPYIQEMFSRINPDIDANDYSVAFMWGTTGILYNAKYVTDEEASTFDIIRNPKFAGKIFIKDAPRDVYGPVMIYLNQDKLKSGEITLDDLMKDSSDESIAAVEEYMKQVRELVAGWEADFGKEQMTQERGYVSFNWSGDAVWAIEEAEEIGVDLRYIVPEEGSNVWFDGWVIPKYSKNVKAATYFIDFMCRPDIAIRNMDVTGYVSANGDRSVLDSQIDEDRAPIDVSYFFPGATSVQVNPALYPDRKTIENCAILHDWGNETDKLISMWSRIKGDNASAMTVIVLVGVVVLFGFIVCKRIFKKKTHKK